MRLLQVTEDMDSGSRQETGLETGQQCGSCWGAGCAATFYERCTLLSSPKSWREMGLQVPCVLCLSLDIGSGSVLLAVRKFSFIFSLLFSCGCLSPSI